MPDMQQKKTKTNKFWFITTLCLSVVFVIFPLLVKSSSIDELNQQISEKKQKIEKLTEETSKLESSIGEKQQEAANLQTQIDILDGEISKTEIEIEKIKTEIEQVKLEIQSVEIQIKEKEKEIAKQKDILAEFIRVMYLYDQKSAIEIILGYNSFSDLLNQIKYTEILENRGQETLDKIQELKRQLDWQKQVLESKKKALEDLKSKLENEQKKLSLEKQSKESLLSETQAQEIQYQGLLDKAKQEQDAINQEMRSLLLEIEKKKQEGIGDRNYEWGGDATAILSWPVDPSRGISAYFHDSTYPFRYLFEHNAIDIRCYQGTPIKASADGYVIKARNAGYGYNYIMLLHSGGLATKYGHVSAIYVSEGQFILQGEIIGLSGGTPGTPGAGWLTTGPHLHFEVWKDGTPVDPLSYLP